MIPKSINIKLLLLSVFIFMKSDMLMDTNFRLSVIALLLLSIIPVIVFAAVLSIPCTNAIIDVGSILLC